jgi:hypothetical protein
MFGDDGGAGLLSWQLAAYRSLDAMDQRRQNNQMYQLNLEWQVAYDQVVQQRDQYRAGRNEAVRAHNSLLDRHEALIAKHRELKAANEALAAEKARMEERCASLERSQRATSESASAYLRMTFDLDDEKAQLAAENERLLARLRALEGGATG